MQLSEREVFTIDEAAEFARVTPGKVRQWLDDGLKGWRTGGEAGRSGPASIIIMREHLLAYIRAKAEGPARSAPAAAPDAPPRARRGRPPKAGSKPTGGGAGGAFVTID